MTQEKIAVWFSCGAASAIAAKLTLQKYGKTHAVRVVNNPVVEEDADNRRFLRDVQRWLGVRIETAINPEYSFPSAEDVWDRRQFMSGNHGAPCTIELKKKARQIWEKDNLTDWHVLGFTVEEKDRFDRFKLTERDNVLPVLINAGLSKQDCVDLLVDAGIAPPRLYLDGYPNANCIGCVKATSPTYWNLVREKHPDVFARRAAQSREIGAKLARCHPQYLHWCEQRDGEWYDTRTGECLHITTASGQRKLESPRVFLDELPAEAVGRPLKTMQIDCGIFCEEPEAA
jgi:hypothetical protein